MYQHDDDEDLVVYRGQRVTQHAQEIERLEAMRKAASASTKVRPQQSVDSLQDAYRTYCEAYGVSLQQGGVQ